MKKILLVHDTELFLRMEQTILRREDCQIYKALDGETALELAREKRPDLVILDDGLQDPGPEEICRAIREDPRTLRASILMVVSRSNREKLDDFLTAGANDYVVKPVNRLLFNQRATSLLNVPSRRFLRTLVRVDVQGTEGGRPFFGSTVDLSESGLLVETPKTLEIGRKIQAQFFLPGDTQAIRVGCEVVRAASSAASGRKAYGLAFTRIEDDAWARIREFVAMQHPDGGGSGGSRLEPLPWEEPPPPPPTAV